MDVLMTPKVIQVEKSLATEGTCQPHPHKVTAHMCAYGGLGVEGLPLHPSTWHL